MGSSASKAVRKYPEAASKASEAAVKTGRAGPSTTGVLHAARLAESHRSDAIEKDAVDPDFLANLSKLGQVRVDHHMQAVRPEAVNTKTLFESRAESSVTVGPNRLYGFALSDLLAKRKSVKTRDELRRLADEYRIDVGKLERLAQFVTVPSVDGSSIRPVKKDGTGEEEGLVGQAVWIEPSIKS